MAGEGINLATAYVQLTTSAEGVGKEIIEKVGAAGDKAGAEGGDAAGKSFGQKFTSVITSGKAIAGGAIVGALVGATKGLYEVGSIFDDVSDTIRIGAGAAGEDLDGLVDVAKNVGKNVPVDFEKVGGAIADLNTRFGFSGDLLDTVAQQYLQAGHILGEDVDVNKTSAAFAAFGIEGEGVVDAMDNLFRVSQATGVGMNELATTAQTQGSVLKNLGFSFEDSISLMGQLDKAGVNSQAVMASMGKGLVTLAKDGEEPADAFQRVIGEVEGFIDAGDTAAALDVASKIFGTRGAAQFVGAVQSGTLAVDDLMAATGATGDTIIGVAKETADLSESWQLFKNRALVAIEPVASRVFDLLSSGMAKAADLIEPLIEGVQWVADLFKGDATSGVGDFVKAFKGVMPVVSPFSAIMKVIQPILPRIMDALKKIGQVVGGVVMSVLKSVTPLFEKVGEVINVLASYVSDLVARLLPPLMGLFEKISPLLQAVFDAVMPVVDAIISALIPALDALMPVVEFVFELFEITLGTVIEVLGGVIDFITSVFTGDWSGAWDAIVKIFTAYWDGLKKYITKLWDGVKAVASAVWDAIKVVIQAPMDALSKSMSAIWDGIKSFVTGVWDGIKVIALAVWDGIRLAIVNPIQAAWDWLTNHFAQVAGFLAGLWDSIKGAASTAWEAVKSFITTPIQAAWDWVTGHFATVAGFLVGLWGDIKAGAVEKLELARAAIVAPFQAAWDWVKNTFDGIVETFSGIWNGIVNGATTILGGIKSAVSSAFSGLTDLIKKPINAVISLVNSAIGSINGISVDLPFGMGHVGFNIPKIPSLAVGGVVSSPTLAVVGDAGRGNPEIVAPQRMLRQIIADELRGGGVLESKIDALIAAIQANADSTRRALSDQVYTQRDLARMGAR